MTNHRTKMIAGFSIAAALTGGSLAVAALPAVAETTSGADATSTPAPDTDTDTGAKHGGPGHGPRGEELTGDTAAQVEAAVLAEYPDATIERLETDPDGAYEAHLTQADGTRLMIELDESFAITGTRTGGPGHGPRGDRPERDATDSDADEPTDTDADADTDTDTDTDADTDAGTDASEPATS